MKSASPPVARRYKSDVRDRQAEQTREKILAAALDRLRDGEQALSLANVAAAAGVALRTVFRHFPTKEALLDATWARLNAELGLERFPADVDDLLRRLPKNFEQFDQHAPLVTGYLFSPQGRELRRRANPARRAEIRACLAAALADVPPAQADRVAAIVGLLISVPAWHVLTDRNDLTGRQAADAVAWAVRTLLDASATSKDEKRPARAAGPHV